MHISCIIYIIKGQKHCFEMLLPFFCFLFKNASPPGVPPDLQSGVKKCPNLFRLCGFAIRSKGVCFSFCWGITNPPVLIGRTFFTADFKSAGTPSGVAGLEYILYNIYNKRAKALF